MTQALSIPNGVRARNGETVFLATLYNYGYTPTCGKRFIYQVQNYLAGMFVKTDRLVKVQVLQEGAVVGEFAYAGGTVMQQLNVPLMPPLKEGPVYAKVVFEKRGVCHIAIGVWKVTGKRISRKSLGRRIILRRATLIPEVEPRTEEEG